MNNISLSQLNWNTLISTMGFSLALFFVLGFTLLILSSYIKVVTVLGIVRAGLGGYGLPSSFVVIGLSLALSFFVMFPTLRDASMQMDKVITEKKGPLTDEVRIAALEAASEEWKNFLKKHADGRERKRLAQIAYDWDLKRQQKAMQEKTLLTENPEQKKEREIILIQLEESWRVLPAAFLVSELQRAFLTGLSIFLPFLVVDLVVANVLITVGLMQLNPAMVSFPLKLLLFVLTDGWTLITTNLVLTYLR